jgi:hypothetical protein
MLLEINGNIKEYVGDHLGIDGNLLGKGKRKRERWGGRGDREKGIYKWKYIEKY